MTDSPPKPRRITARRVVVIVIAVIAFVVAARAAIRFADANITHTDQVVEMELIPPAPPQARTDPAQN